ncbi:MAG: TPM domain-containing protein [Chitinophagales bacterium]
MKLLKHFSEEELQKIEAAVKEAESGISGEIVPVFVEQCDNYELAYYRAASITALCTFSSIVLLDRFWAGFQLYDPFYYLLNVLFAAMVAISLVHYFPLVKRLFVGTSKLYYEADERADAIFLREEVFNSTHRTGVMIFVAFFEHQVIVKADKGISSVVNQKEWEEVVELVIEGIKKDELAEGILKGIKRCAHILEANEFIVDTKNLDELSNKLRTD